MNSLCGADCDNCGFGKNMNCKGCIDSNGCPFGKKCFVANYIQTGGIENYKIFIKELVLEINNLDIPGMPKISTLNPLNGAFVNLQYTLPNGKIIDFLNNDEIYLGNQVESEFNDGSIVRCFGILASLDFIMISEYGINGDNPELIVYKKR